MKRVALLLAVLFAMGPATLLASPHKTVKSHKSHKAYKAHKATYAEPKSEVTKLRKARKEDPTVRQVTVDPKKSPGKHADNLSKNVNHELNRESKDINHFFQGKKK